MVGCAGIAREIALKKSFWDLFGMDGSLDQVNPMVHECVICTPASGARGSSIGS